MENFNKWSMKVILPVPGKNPINPKQKNKCCNWGKREDRKTQGHVLQSLGHTVKENFTLHRNYKLHIAQSHPCSGLSLEPLLHSFTPQLLLQHPARGSGPLQTDRECPREPQEPRSCLWKSL